MLYIDEKTWLDFFVWFEERRSLLLNTVCCGGAHILAAATKGEPGKQSSGIAPRRVKSRAAAKKSGPERAPAIKARRICRSAVEEFQWRAE